MRGGVEWERSLALYSLPLSFIEQHYHGVVGACCLSLDPISDKTRLIIHKTQPSHYINKHV